VRFTLSFEIENDAFTPTPGPEIARILRATAGRVEATPFPEGWRAEGPYVAAARDVNGNRVGGWRIE
jgi:hypothetical protein